MEFEYVLKDEMSDALERIAKSSDHAAKAMKKADEQQGRLNKSGGQSAGAAGQSNAQIAMRQVQFLDKQYQASKKLGGAEEKRAKESLKYAKENAEHEKKKEQGSSKVVDALSMTAALAVGAAVAVGGLATKLSEAAIAAAELHKQSIRKLSFGLGKPGDVKAAEDELALVKKIRDVTGGNESDITERIRSLLATGYDKTSAENIVTIAEDARSAGDAASQAVIEAYDSFKQTQNDLVNGGRGMFDKATFDKLVKSGAVDRASALKDIAAAYKTNERGALRMLQAGMVTADIGENVVTKNLGSRFNKGGAIGTESKTRAGDSIDTQLNRVKNRFGDVFAKVNDKPIIGIITKVGDLLDPDNPRIKRFSDMLSKTFEYVGNFIDRVSGGNTGATVGGMFDKIADRADAFFRVLDKAGDAWDNKISPALDKLMKALAPLLKDLGLTKDTFSNTEDVDQFGDSLDGVATVAAAVIDAIASIVRTIDDMVKSIKEAVDWAGRMKTALTSAPSNAVTSTKNTTKAIVDKALSFLPGFATGLERVPFDNFPAKLHKDERVLTADEARAYGRSLAPPPPSLSLGAGPLGGRGTAVVTVNVTVNADGASSNNPAALAQHVGDEVRTQLLELLESLGYQTGAIAS